MRAFSCPNVRVSSDDTQTIRQKKNHSWAVSCILSTVLLGMTALLVLAFGREEAEEEAEGARESQAEEYFGHSWADPAADAIEAIRLADSEASAGHFAQALMSLPKRAVLRGLNLDAQVDMLHIINDRQRIWGQAQLEGLASQILRLETDMRIFNSAQKPRNSVGIKRDTNAKFEDILKTYESGKKISACRNADDLLNDDNLNGRWSEKIASFTRRRCKE